MKEIEELELILKLIGKYNLPLNLVLAHAIRDKIDEYSRKADAKHNAVLEDNPAHESEGENEDTSNLSFTGNSVNTSSNSFNGFKIDNKTYQCFVINKNGKRVFSASGKLKIVDGSLYRIYCNKSSLAINLVHWDGDKEKYRLGEKIVYAQKGSPLYGCLNKSKYLEQIKAIIYDYINRKYKVVVDGRWYDNIGDTTDLIVGREIEKPNEDNVSPKESLSKPLTNNPKRDLGIVNIGHSSIAVIGNTEPYKDTLKAMGGYAMVETEWGPAWVFSSSKRERLQAYIDGDTFGQGKRKKKTQRNYSSRFTICVKYPNGSEFSSEEVGKSLIDVIIYAGPERVRQLNIKCLGDNLVSSKLGKNSIYRAAQKKIGLGLYVCICSSAEIIYQQILMINARCHLGLKVEKVYNDKQVRANQDSSDSEEITNKRKRSEDRRVGYTVRMLPSQKRGVIIGIRNVYEGYKRLVIKTDNGHLIEIDDNPYVYVVLKRK